VQEGNQHFAHGYSSATPKASLQVSARALHQQRFGLASPYGELKVPLTLRYGKSGTYYLSVQRARSAPPVVRRAVPRALPKANPRTGSGPGRKPRIAARQIFTHHNHNPLIDPDQSNILWCRLNAFP